jgi:hypothetical protein
MPQIIDNLGAPMIPTADPNIWIGNLGSLIDIRTNMGSCGSPLVEVMTPEEIKAEHRRKQINTLLI